LRALSPVRQRLRRWSWRPSSIESEGDASADDCDRARKKLEDLVQAAQTRVDETVGRKEKDIIEI